MARLLYHDFYRDKRKYRIAFLAFIWLTGMILGIGSLKYAGEGFFPLIRMAVSRQVPLMRMLLVSYLPYVLSLFAIWIGLPHLLIVICFLKSWLFGFISVGCLTAFGSAGWLISFLIFFREWICMVLLWWLWICHSEQDQRIRWGQVGISLAVIAGIVCLDYYYISPFLVTLLEL